MFYWNDFHVIQFQFQIDINLHQQTSYHHIEINHEDFRWNIGLPGINVLNHWHTNTESVKQERIRVRKLYLNQNQTLLIILH